MAILKKALLIKGGNFNEKDIKHVKRKGKMPN